MPASLEFDEAPPPPGDAFRIDVDGFEGPLDLLLALARRQKVDLQRISILALAEQFLAFVEAARERRLELAADYLVMAAWLAYLKSRLLLPEPPRGEEPNARDLAAALALRLRRLDAVRALARHLADRDRLGREVFSRGPSAGPPSPSEARAFTATIHDLLAAYARQRRSRAVARVEMPRRAVWSLVEARAALERLIGPLDDWTPLDRYLAAFAPGGRPRATILASSLSAALELAREGRVAIRQAAPYAPLWIRRVRPEPG